MLSLGLIVAAYVACFLVRVAELRVKVVVD